MEFRFKPGDVCFIASRYEGIQRVTIVSQVEYEDGPRYELDKLIQINKSGDKVGNKYDDEYEDFFGDIISELPCPQSHLFIVGDPSRDVMSNFFGCDTGKIFTQEEANNII